MINGEIIDNNTTTLNKFSKNKWQTVSQIKYKYLGNESMIQIPRQLIDQNKVALDFHSADNIDDY